MNLRTIKQLRETEVINDYEMLLLLTERLQHLDEKLLLMNINKKTPETAISEVSSDTLNP
jgi:hypothetical protein